MTDIRFLGRSEDGAYVLLTDDEGNEFRLPLDDDLRAAISQPRLVAVSNYYDQTDSDVITVKEVQARLRAGASFDEISQLSGWTLEKIDKYAGPILQERAYVIDIALKSPLRRDSNSPLLGLAAHSQLAPRGVDMEEVEWNTFRFEDGTWEIILNYPSREGTSSAHWNFDLHKRALIAEDDGARWINGDERDQRVKTPTHGIIYQNENSTPAPRLVAVRPENFESETAPIQPVRTEEIAPDAKRDGVTKRIKIPSWDDIMFGAKGDNTSQIDPNEEE